MHATSGGVTVLLSTTTPSEAGHSAGTDEPWPRMRSHSWRLGKHGAAPAPRCTGGSVSTAGRATRRVPGT